MWSDIEFVRYLTGVLVGLACGFALGLSIGGPRSKS